MTIESEISPGMASLGDLEAPRDKPWWEQGAVRQVEEHLSRTPGARVLEYGAGGSTVWLAQRCIYLRTVEHVEQWVPEMDSDWSAYHSVALYDLDRGYVEAHGEGPYDLVAVDGRRRVDCVRAAARLVIPGGLLLLDDAQRPRYAPAAKLLSSWELNTHQGETSRVTAIWQKPIERDDWILGKYSGAAAAGYDENRTADPKWQGEHEAVREALRDLPRGSSVLDCPVGTGRFFEIYRAAGLRCTGVDLSEDMLAEAINNRQNECLVLHDCRELDSGLFGAPFDAVICVRLLNVLTEIDVKLTLRSFLRLLTPGGRIIVSLKDEEGIGDSKPRTIHDAGFIRRLTDDLGLVLVGCRDVPHKGGGRYRVLSLRRAGG